MSRRRVLIGTVSALPSDPRLQRWNLGRPPLWRNGLAIKVRRRLVYVSRNSERWYGR